MSDDLTIPNPAYRGRRAGRYGTGPSRVRAGMDPDTRRLALFAGGLGAVLVALIGASSLIGHHSDQVPVIAADPGPVRFKPENPGGMKIDAAENDVFSGGSDTADAKLAPAAETPDTKALRAEERAGRKPAPAPPVAASPAHAVVAITPPIPTAPPVASPASAVVAIIPPVPTAPPVASPAPVARPAAEKPLTAAAVAPPAAAGRPAMVQLAALTSEEAARAEWQLLSKRMPELLTGRQPAYSKIERDGHVFWRVRTAGFADAGQARTFCDHVRAKGGGCSVADF